MLQLEAAMTFMRGFGRWMGLCAVAAVLVVSSGCGGDGAAEQVSTAEIEFGIWVPDAYGELEFRATDQVPNIDDQAFGWRVRVDDAQEPVKWIESMTLPEAPESWEGVEEDLNVVVSEDGRKATFTFRLGEAEALPEGTAGDRI